MAEIIDLRVSQERDLICHEKDNFIMEFEVLDDAGDPFDFTGYTAKMTVKSRRVEGDPEVLVFQTGGQGITLASGSLLVEKTSASMATKSGKYVYDLKLTSGAGVVETWLWGKIEIQGTVTV